MELHYKKIGSGLPIVILHGLFGSSDNWQTLGKRLGEDYEVYLVDMRNHGRSPHSDTHNYDVMAADIYAFFREHHLYDAVLVGHSMGGKAAITFAQQNPDLIEKLIVVDMGLKQYPSHHDLIIESLKAVDLNLVKSRQEAYEVVSGYLEDEGVKQFLLKNLYWVEKGQLGWRFNLEVLENQLQEILVASDDVQVDLPTLFIRGELSNYILESDYETIKERFPKAQIETIRGVGHWVHAEAPDAFYELLVDMIEG